MTTAEQIIQKIEKEVFISHPVTETSSLYTDLGFDSIMFISLLIEIEAAFSIVIDIDEMEQCVQVGQLIALVEKKSAERGVVND